MKTIAHVVEEAQDEVSRIGGELSQLKDCQIRSIGRQTNITNHYWNSCEDWKAAVDYFKTEMKQRAIQVISTIMDLINVARHQGVIALENEFLEGKSTYETFTIYSFIHFYMGIRWNILRKALSQLRVYTI